MIRIVILLNQAQAVLDRAARSARNLETIMRAAGTALLSITLGNFNAAGADLRPIPWKPKADGTPTTLKRSGLLSSSFRLTVGRSSAEISNPTPYASIHQFGGRTAPHTIVPRGKKALAFTSAKFGNVVVRSVNHPGSNIPARPFFPITPDGGLTPEADRLIANAAQRQLDKQIS